MDFYVLLRTQTRLVTRAGDFEQAITRCVVVGVKCRLRSACTQKKAKEKRKCMLEKERMMECHGSLVRLSLNPHLPFRLSSSTKTKHMYILLVEE